MDALEQQLQDSFVHWVSQRLSRIERRPNSWAREKAQRDGTLISWWNYDWAIQWPALTQPRGVLEGCTAFDHVDPVLPQMQFEPLPPVTALEFPFPPAGSMLEEDDVNEIECRLRAEQASTEEAILASAGDDNLRPSVA